MPTLSYPGVYVQEIPSGVRPLEAASTSTAAFVGLAEMGPTGATRVTSWTEFQRLFGSFFGNSFLAHGVFQFFNNGGRQCYIVRVVPGDAATASVRVRNRFGTPQEGWRFSAKNAGAWGNSLLVQIEDGTLDPGNSFRLSIRRQADPAGPVADSANLAPLEVFDNLSVDPADPNFAGSILARDSALLTAELLTDDTNGGLQRGLHRGNTGFQLPLGSNTSLQVSVDHDGFQAISLAAASAATTLSDVAIAITNAVKALPKKKSSTKDVAFGNFLCSVEGSGASARLLMQSGTTDVATSSVLVQPAASNDATHLLKLGAGQGGVSQDGQAVRRPALAAAVQVGDAAVTPPVTAAVAGVDGDDDVADTVFAAAFHELDNVTDFSLLAVPGEGSTAMFDLGTQYCANRPLQDAFFIGEMGEFDDTPERAAQFRNQLTSANSYGALYFPWVRAQDPTGRSRQPILLPPSGHLAGLYARIDASRGVWKAPAGVEASISGVVGLATELSDVEHGNLNPLGVDVIRRFPGAGVVAFGARTVTSDPEWRYVPVRRTAIMLRVSIYNGIQFAVFEPNDEPLWAQLRLNIGAFMTTLFRQGAFAGSTPSQGFFVKCDAETTTQADIDAGVVNVLVGFAPQKPAEFVVVRISQKAGLASG